MARQKVGATDYGPIADKMREAGLPVDGIRVNAGQPEIVWQAGVSPTQQQIDLANQILNDPLNYVRQRRSVRLIKDEIAALSAGNQSAVWTDLSSGTPAKILATAGQNNADIMTMEFIIRRAGLSGAALTEARQLAAAFYVQDNPRYLNNPPFAPAIMIHGDEPLPA